MKVMTQLVVMVVAMMMVMMMVMLMFSPPYLQLATAEM